MNLCETIQNTLMDLIDGVSSQTLTTDETLLNHLRNCVECHRMLTATIQIRKLYKKLPDHEVPFHLSREVMSEIADAMAEGGQKGLLASFFAAIFKPIPVFASGLALTALGVFLWNGRLSDSGSALSTSQEFASVSSDRPFVRPAPLPFDGIQLPTLVSEQPNQDSLQSTEPNQDLAAITFTANGSNVPFRLMNDFNELMLEQTDLLSLEVLSSEAVASFRYHLALRQVFDGDYQAASRVLRNLIDEDLNYSRWEEAVVLHLSVMKKLGKTDEVEKDLARLKEYTTLSPEAERSILHGIELP